MKNNEINNLRAETLHCNMGGKNIRPTGRTSEASLRDALSRLGAAPARSLRSAGDDGGKRTRRKAGVPVPRAADSPARPARAAQTGQKADVRGAGERGGRKVRREAGYNGLWWLVGGDRYVRDVGERVVGAIVVRSGSWRVVVDPDRRKGEWVNARVFRDHKSARKRAYSVGVNITTREMDRRRDPARLIAKFPTVAAWVVEAVCEWSREFSPDAVQQDGGTP